MFGERLGISICGGVRGYVGNFCDFIDEGIFIFKVSFMGVVGCDGWLCVGLWLLEVN